jgi:hypothetical protein
VFEAVNRDIPFDAYLNLASPIGPTNIIDLHPVLDLEFGEKLTTSADGNFFWRESLDDGIYSLSGIPRRSGPSSSGPRPTSLGPVVYWRCCPNWSSRTPAWDRRAKLFECPGSWLHEHTRLVARLLRDTEKTRRLRYCGGL